MTAPDLVEVWAWDQRVGAVAPDPESGSYAFEYDPEWIRLGIELAPFHLPNRAGVFSFPSLSRRTYYGLPAMLADALPDRFGTALVNRWLTENGTPASSITPLDRLAYAADRAIGALEFRSPSNVPAPDVTAIQLADLVAAARASFTGESSSSADAYQALLQLIQVGTSAGGARPKAVIAFNEATGQVRSGHAAMPAGFDQWLVKFDGVGRDGGPGDLSVDGPEYGKVEYAYYLMAKACGIEISESWLLAEGPRTHFLTKRFDRAADGSKLHLQSLCALAHLDYNMAGTHSYAQYLSVVDALDLGSQARNQAFRRMVFNVAAVNRDDHTKNFGFLCTPAGVWKLAPAFDLSFAYNPDGRWTVAHQMSVNGKTEDIELADLRAVGDRFEVPDFNDTIAEVLAVVERWADFAQDSEVAPNRIAAISAVLEQNRPR